MSLFEKGVSGNPAGRPKGLLTGRAKALYALDQVVSREENIALIEGALEKTLREKPMWFFINVIMPLLPKETKGVLETGDEAVHMIAAVMGKSICWSDDQEENGSDRTKQRFHGNAFVFVGAHRSVTAR